jgi:hypothetical protein
MQRLPSLAGLPIVAAFLAVVLASGAVRSDPVVPAADTAERALLDGLKLIRDGKFDAWVSQWCSTKELCFTEKSIDSLKKYNLPVIQRLAPRCIRGTGDALEITRTVVDDKGTKVFVACDPDAQPRPFTLVKEGKGWRFKAL